MDSWGKIVIIDLEDCKPELISDKAYLKKFIIEICKVIKMKRYGECYIKRFGKEDTFGMSGFQFIETSSITIHLAEKTNQAFIDIFSCKDFNENQALEFCQKFYKAKQSKILVHERGSK